jgi:2-polyprenyl-3-methyl-5-hydroxy-6-metoxy-1,4-benzoquinol methylase
MAQVDSKVYSEEYYAARCGGAEFFNKYGAEWLKPAFQAAVQLARLQKGQKMLDLGCGRGELVAHLTSKGFDIEGIDYAKDAVQFAQKHFPDGRYREADIIKTPLPENSYDRIFFLGTIEHMTDIEIKHTLGAISKSLKEGGLLIISTCTNGLYFKTVSYQFRKWVTQSLNNMGLKLKEPSPPRSEEDELMHINEQHYFSLRKLLKKAPFKFKIVARPNPKLATCELYGESLPPGFPIRAAKVWKQKLYRSLVFHFPFSMLLARQYIVICQK